MADYLAKIKRIITEKTGLESTEIVSESFLEDDLNLGGMELIEVLEDLEEEFHVDLIENADNFETVQDIVDTLEENIQ